MENDFIGRRFGEAGHLEVIGITEEKSGNNFKYKVLCHNCKLDPELFGNGEFLSVKWCLKDGIIPCGCGKNVRWSSAQFKTRVLRKCIEKDYTLIEFKEEVVDSNTKIKLKCNKDGWIWDSVRVVSFLVTGHGCPKCKSTSISKRSRKSDEDTSLIFMKTGKFVEGTTFRRTDETSNKGVYYWEVFCPTCAKNEESSGLFKAFSSNLAKGCVPCICAPKTGFKRNLPASLYVMQISSDVEGFTGFGISNDFSVRLGAHRRNLNKHGYSITELEVFHTSGIIAKSVETLIKMNFEVNPQKILGFKTESTFLHNYMDIIEFVDTQITIKEAEHERV